MCLLLFCTLQGCASTTEKKEKPMNEEQTISTENTEDNTRQDIIIEKEGPLSIQMSDYGHMEKVGNIGTTLPSNNEQITTEAGDLILYMGNSFVIYYAPNSWNLTRLGKIQDITAADLKKVLGNGEVTVTLYSLGCYQQLIEHCN